jgi:hypothetical protein
MDLEKEDYEVLFEKMNTKLEEIDDKVIESWHRIKWVGRKIKGFFKWVGSKFKRGVKEATNVASVLGSLAATGLKTLLLVDGGKDIRDYIDSKHTCLCGQEIDVDRYWDHINTECTVIMEFDQKVERAERIIEKVDNDAKLSIEKAKATRGEMLTKIEFLNQKKKENFTKFNEHLCLLRDISFLNNEEVKKAIEKEKKAIERKEKLKNAHGLKKLLMFGVQGLSKLQILANLALKLGVTLFSMWLLNVYILG